MIELTIRYPSALLNVERHEITEEQAILIRQLLHFVCHCPTSTARDGHYHETDGYVLCLHYDGEDGSACPQVTK